MLHDLQGYKEILKTEEFSLYFGLTQDNKRIIVKVENDRHYVLTYNDFVTCIHHFFDKQDLTKVTSLFLATHEELLNILVKPENYPDVAGYPNKSFHLFDVTDNGLRKSLIKIQNGDVILEDHLKDKHEFKDHVFSILNTANMETRVSEMLFTPEENHKFRLVEFILEHNSSIALDYEVNRNNFNDMVHSLVVNFKWSEVDSSFSKMLGGLSVIQNHRSVKITGINPDKPELELYTTLSNSTTIPKELIVRAMNNLIKLNIKYLLERPTKLLEKIYK